MTRRKETIAALLVVAGAVALVLIANRGTWFYLDDWDFAWRAADFSDDSIFNPQNQNWHTTVVLVYRAMLEVFGMSSYVPFRLLEAALVAGLGVLAYLYARERIGPWWALIPVALIVVSPGFEPLLWPFQIGLLMSAVSGLGAILLLDREPTRAALIGAGALLVVAVASSSAGVPLVAVAVYDRLLRPGRRLEALVGLPAMLAYVLWYAEYGAREPKPNQLDAAAFNAAASRAIDIGDGVVQSLLGLSSQGAKGSLIGQIGLAVLVVVVCWRIFGPYSQGRGRVIALAGGLVTYWCLLAWGRALQPGIELSPRYVFLSQVLIVLLLVEVAVGVVAIRWAQPARVVAAGVVMVVAGLALIDNVRAELDFGDILRDNARAMRGQVYGVSLLEDDRRAAASVFLEPLGSQIGRPTAQFFEPLDRFGWPTPSEADVRDLPAVGRARADQAQFAAYVSPTPSPASNLGGAPPEPIGRAGGEANLTVSGPCLTMRAMEGQSAFLEVRPPATGMAVVNRGVTPLAVHGRRYAGDWTGPAKVDVAPRTALPVSLPPDRGSPGWRIAVAGEAARLCALRGG